MMKIFNIINCCAVAALALFVACDNADSISDAEQSKGKVITISASTDEPDTRISLEPSTENSSLVLNWVATDQLELFTGNVINLNSATLL